jgi:hypothetical protein
MDAPKNGPAVVGTAGPEIEAFAEGAARPGLTIKLEVESHTFGPRMEAALAAIAAMDGLSAQLEPDVFAALRGRLEHVINAALEASPKLIEVKPAAGSAAGTCKVDVRCDLRVSDDDLAFLAAVGTGEADAIRHLVNPSVVCLATSTVAEAGAGVESVPADAGTYSSTSSTRLPRDSALAAASATAQPEYHR